MSAQEDRLEAVLKDRLPPGLTLKREVQFHPERKWRLDFLIPEAGVAVEIQGRGRHQTLIGERKDLEKFNAVAEMGGTLLLYQAADIKNVEAWAEQIVRVAESKRG